MGNLIFAGLLFAAVFVVLMGVRRKSRHKGPQGGFLLLEDDVEAFERALKEGKKDARLGDTLPSGEYGPETERRRREMVIPQPPIKHPHAMVQVRYGYRTTGHPPLCWWPPWCRN